VSCSLPGVRRSEQDVVPLRTAAKVWTLVALQSFGGPAGQIAVMQRTLVDERRWIGRGRFLHALNFCTILPGPEATQLAVYIGWLLNGVRGGLMAGVLFVLPGVLAIGALSAVYVAFGDTTAVTGLFAGIAPAVLAIVAQAVVRIGGRALGSPALVVVAVLAFASLAFFGVPFPIVVLAAGVVGWLLGRRRPGSMTSTFAEEDAPAPLIADEELHDDRPTLGRTGRVLAVGLTVWWLPVLLVVVLTGRDSTLSTEGLFFSGTAMVTFGGAYAVLSYVAQHAVQDHGWLGPGEMVRGLGLAETTPGPLIMVLQFVGFLGAYRDPGSLDPWVAASLGALLTTWVTFVPAMLLVFLGAPYVERLRSNRAVASALAGVTAAVVGVIANLALFFALHTLFDDVVRHDVGPLHVDVPDLTTLRPLAVVVAVLAAVLLFRTRWSVLRTLGVCALVGLAAALLGVDPT
jgi:chromate transporter